MLIHTLIQYLESHRRLVVPQLGTFIVKEPGRSVVFSELLKRDDGVLRGLLRAGGMGELEAAGEIDRVVEVRGLAVQRQTDRQRIHKESDEIVHVRVSSSCRRSAEDDVGPGTDAAKIRRQGREPNMEGTRGPGRGEIRDVGRQPRGSSKDTCSAG